VAGLIEHAGGKHGFFHDRDDSLISAARSEQEAIGLQRAAEDRPPSTMPAWRPLSAHGIKIFGSTLSPDRPARSLCQDSSARRGNTTAVAFRTRKLVCNSAPASRAFISNASSASTE